MTACIGRHDDTPPLPEPGLLLCGKHYNDLRGDLRDVASYWVLAHTMVVPGSARGHGSGKRIDPPAPVRLDILDILDERRIPNSDEIRSEVAQHVIGWAAVYSEEQQLTRPTSVLTAAELLAVHVDRLAAQPWIDEAMPDIRRAARLLRSAVHDVSDPVVGTCWQIDDHGDVCAGRLRVRTTWHPTEPGLDQVAVICSKCRDVWTADDLTHVGRVSPMHLWESVTRIAGMLDVPVRTVRHWAATGKIRRNSLGQVLHAEAWQHANRRDTPSM